MFNSQLPIGKTDYSNQNADNFLKLLKEDGIDTIDLRALMHAEGLDHNDAFLKTDHHWKLETGFWASTKIIDYLERVNPIYTVDSNISDITQYQTTTYRQFFLGSRGRRVGPYFGGLDDITVISPRFETELEWYSPYDQVRLSGNFDKTLLRYDKLNNKNIYEASGYDVYLIKIIRL